MTHVFVVRAYDVIHVYVCDLTHVCVCAVTHMIHVYGCDVTYLYACHDSQRDLFMCDMTHLHK